MDFTLRIVQINAYYKENNGTKLTHFSTSQIQSVTLWHWTMRDYLTHSLFNTYPESENPKGYV